MKKLMFYLAGIITLVWGIAHLLPTAGTVEGFGDISHDNRLIITMEWIVEGMALIFIGLLTMLVTYTDSQSRLAFRVYSLIIVMLLALSVLSLLTGFRVDFFPFKLCPLLFSVSAVLIGVGMALKPLKNAVR